VSLSVVRCAFDDSRPPSPCFVAIQHIPHSAPCVQIFGSVAWYPVFLRHKIHRHLACQVGGCGVFSSRSASTWVTIVITVFVVVLSTRAVVEHVFKFSMAWRPLGKSASQRSVTSALGASRRSLDPFAVRPGRRASSQTSWRVTTGPPIPWSSLAVRRQCSCSWRRWERHGKLVSDGHKGRALPVAQRIASEVHLILEGSLRVLPRQIRIPGTRARGCVRVCRP
jgi:hypothetical protein